MRRAIVPWLAWALIGTSLTSCGGPLPPPLGPQAQVAYALDAGDKLRVTVFNENNLTGEYSVAPSGSVSFPLVGAVVAKGLTTDQLAQAITERLRAGYINDPRVAVELLSFRPYYIFGEVSRPGEYPFVNGMTVEKAIATAGGFTYRANQKIVFVRRGEQEERSVAIRELPVKVLPGDTIRVGERYF